MASDLKRKLPDDNKQEEQSEKRRNVNGTENLKQESSNLVENVLKQGPLGNLVVIVQDYTESPYVVLQNSVACAHLELSVKRKDDKNDIFELYIAGEQLAQGSFKNVQLAKAQLAQITLEKLKEQCFFIEKKSDFVNVTKKTLQETSNINETTSDSFAGEDSIAHKIMKKMGWSGAGLGAQEQGSVHSIMLCENVNREGLGNSNFMREITKKMQDFSKSSNLTLVFDAEFTKEERSLIHKSARKFDLKSKSSGKDSRKLTVSKKATRMDIVKALLQVGGEHGLYKLHIPTRFA